MASSSSFGTFTANKGAPAPPLLPCDGCKLRRIKCNRNPPIGPSGLNEGDCQKCLANGIRCTTSRPRKGIKPPGPTQGRGTAGPVTPTAAGIPGPSSHSATGTPYTSSGSSHGGSLSPPSGGHPSTRSPTPDLFDACIGIVQAHCPRDAGALANPGFSVISPVQAVEDALLCEIGVIFGSAFANLTLRRRSGQAALAVRSFDALQLPSVPDGLRSTIHDELAIHFDAAGCARQMGIGPLCVSLLMSVISGQRLDYLERTQRYTRTAISIIQPLLEDRDPVLLSCLYGDPSFDIGDPTFGADLGLKVFHRDVQAALWTDARADGTDRDLNLLEEVRNEWLLSAHLTQWDPALRRSKDTQCFLWMKALRLQHAFIKNMSGPLARVRAFNAAFVIDWWAELDSFGQHIAQYAAPLPPQRSQAFDARILRLVVLSLEALTRRVTTSWARAAAEARESDPASPLGHQLDGIRAANHRAGSRAFVAGRRLVTELHSSLAQSAPATMAAHDAAFNALPLTTQLMLSTPSAEGNGPHNYPAATKEMECHRLLAVLRYGDWLYGDLGDCVAATERFLASRQPYTG